MVIYIDILILVNFLFDFLLLLTVNIALKRYTKIFRLLLASLFGEITLISLFIQASPVFLSLLKIGMSIIMCLIAFKYQNIIYTFYNILYLWMLSIILGGFVYYFMIEEINYLLIIFIAPFILYLFIKSLKALKKVKNYYYQVEIVIDNITVKTTGFLDTGNHLIDPITKKPIILLNKKKIKSEVLIRSPMYVPYNALNYHGLLECIKPKYIKVGDKIFKNYLVGLSTKDFHLNGANCLLHGKMEDKLC